MYLRHINPNVLLDQDVLQPGHSLNSSGELFGYDSVLAEFCNNLPVVVPVISNLGREDTGAGIEDVLDQYF